MTTLENAQSADNNYERLNQIIAESLVHQSLSSPSRTYTEKHESENRRLVAAGHLPDITIHCEIKKEDSNNTSIDCTIKDGGKKENMLMDGNGGLGKEFRKNPFESGTGGGHSHGQQQGGEGGDLQKPTNEMPWLKPLYVPNQSLDVAPSSNNRL